MWPLMSVHAVSVQDFTSKHGRATLVQAAQPLDCVSALDSPLLLSDSPRYSCPPRYLSQPRALCSTPPFSISCSDLLFAMALLSPCPRHLSLSQPKLANTVLHLYSSSHLQNTVLHTSLWSNRIWAHLHAHVHGCRHIFKPTHLWMISLPYPLSSFRPSRTWLVFHQSPTHTASEAYGERWMEWL